ncbi:MAG TPA: DUF4236 domain-containing protein [Candidatus Limnocylindrales bacterium]|nr:DUF4236 domain-containing protein [Candidatus Limnocylindrales bacterium]
MGWNFRRSINLGGGFRVKLSKSGVGVSGGTRGLRIGIGPRGKRVNVSVPGTGIGYTKQEGWRRGQTRSGSWIGTIVILALLALAAALFVG